VIEKVEGNNARPHTWWIKCSSLYYLRRHFFNYLSGCFAYFDQKKRVCLVLCLNPLNSKSYESIFFKRSLLERDNSWCVLHVVSSRYDVKELHDNDKSVPSILRCSELASPGFSPKQSAVMYSHVLCFLRRNHT
jgi:hypothetical protein